MSSDTNSEPTSNKAMVWVGRVVSAIPVLMLTMSAVMKLMAADAVKEGFTHLQWPIGIVAAIGIAELTGVILYLIPQTAVLGAIVLTGYLGGAIAAHVRMEEGFIGPFLFGVLVWLGLYLRDSRIRALVPWRR